jgi:hypothetical protein
MRNTKELPECPICKGPVKKGSIFGAVRLFARNLFWQEENPDGTDIVLPLGKRKQLLFSAAGGYRCEKCRKIILEY